MSSAIHTIAMEHEIPAGGLGPEPVTLDVRAYLVPHATGLILVDTGMEPSGTALDAALDDLGADWFDVSHVLSPTATPDHVGALAHVRRSAPAAVLMSSPLDALVGLDELSDQQVIGPLRVVATPGHTPGHLSFLDEDQGTLIVGDCLGTVDGRLTRAPQRFTLDPVVAEQSLHSLLLLRGTRMLFGHGPEVADTWEQLNALLDGR